MILKLETLLKKGLDLETATVVYDLVKLYEHDNQFLDEKDLDKLIKKMKRKTKV